MRTTYNTDEYDVYLSLAVMLIGTRGKHCSHHWAVAGSLVPVIQIMLMHDQSSAQQNYLSADCATNKISCGAAEKSMNKKGFCL